MDGRKTSEAFAWAAVLVGVMMCVCTGCDSERAKDFREASGASLEQGVDYIIDGLIDGAFELWEPDASSSAGQSTG